jgi:hypothetical protein
MTLFDEVLEISDRLNKAFLRANPADDPEGLVTVLVSDDEFDAINGEARAAAASFSGETPDVGVSNNFVIVKNVRWLPRSSARADYE